MKYVELSIQELEAESRKLAKQVENDCAPDLVVYLAKGGYLIGQTMAEYFHCSLLEIEAKRPGDNGKRTVRRILQHLPLQLKILLRKIEIRYRTGVVRGKTTRRDVCLSRKFPAPAGAERIVLVDDSIDTGASVNAAMALLESTYPNAKIDVAVLNFFSKGAKSKRPRWFLHENSLLSTPASKDNVDYKRFLEIYNQGLM